MVTERRRSEPRKRIVASPEVRAFHCLDERSDFGSRVAVDSKRKSSKESQVMTNIEVNTCHAIISLSHTMGEIAKSLSRIANILEASVNCGASKADKQADVYKE
jgi:hypothetical protein